MRYKRTELGPVVFCIADVFFHLGPIYTIPDPLCIGQSLSCWIGFLFTQLRMNPIRYGTKSDPVRSVVVCFIVIRYHTLPKLMNGIISATQRIAILARNDVTGLVSMLCVNTHSLELVLYWIYKNDPA